jgi:Domain of unknown function (DUF4153)
MDSRKNFVKDIVLNAKDAFIRFPLTLIFSIIVAVLGVYLVGNPDSGVDMPRIMLSFGLGISFSIAIYLYFERREFKKSKIFANIIPFVFVISYFFLTRSDFSYSTFLKTLQLFIAFHLLISIAPFLFKNEINGFWQFNSLLLQRFLLSVFYSAVLFLGLTLALLFTNYLFDLKFTENLYFKIWILCVFVFQIWILLAGIPKNFKSLNILDSYPSGLKIFIQYMLVPLVLLYLVILYFYLGKIVIGWSLPKGLVGWMVSSLSLFGVLCLLLLYPVREKLETKWTQIFERYFYYLILPLLGMLFVGLFTRIEEYGFTEKRYFLFVLAIWLFIVALYFKISKSNNIKIIPISLSVLALVTAIGPWGAYQVSLRNQMSTLKSLLVENKILVGNQIQKSSRDLTLSDKKKISSSLDYVLENHGIDPLKVFIDKQQLDSFLGKEKKSNPFLNGENYSKVTESMMKTMGLQYIPMWQRAETEQLLNLHSDLSEAAFHLLGYQTLLTFNFYKENKKNSGLGYTVQADFEKASIEVFRNNSLMMSIPISNYIKRFQEIKMKKAGNIIPFQEMLLDSENDRLKVKIYFKDIYATIKENSIEISSFGGIILLNEKSK